MGGGGITVFDNEEFNLVLTGVDLQRIKAIKFTTVVIIIIIIFNIFIIIFIIIIIIIMNGKIGEQHSW